MRFTSNTHSHRQQCTTGICAGLDDSIAEWGPQGYCRGSCASADCIDAHHQSTRQQDCSSLDFSALEASAVQVSLHHAPALTLRPSDTVQRQAPAQQERFRKDRDASTWTVYWRLSLRFLPDESRRTACRVGTSRDASHRSKAPDRCSTSHFDVRFGFIFSATIPATVARSSDGWNHLDSVRSDTPGSR